MRLWYFFPDIQVRGYYPNYALKEFERENLNIPIRDGDKESLAKGKVDYLGFSYYMSNAIDVKTENDKQNEVHGSIPFKVENPYIEESDWGWAIDPIGLRYTLNRFWDNISNSFIL